MSKIIKKNYVIVTILILIFFGILTVGKKYSNSDIKIGILVPLTKSNAQFGNWIKNGIIMFIDEINSFGGINGKKKLKYVEYDDEDDPTKAVLGYNFLKDCDVDAVITGVDSNEGFAVTEEGKNENVPIIMENASADEITYDKRSNKAYENIFRIGFNDPVSGKKTAQFAKSMGWKNVAVLFCSESEYSSGVKNVFVDECKNLGIKVSSEESFAAESVDFQQQLNNIKSSSPDAIFIPFYYEKSGLIVQQARSLEINCTLLGGDSWSGILDSVPEPSLLNNCYYFASFAPDDPNESSRDFTEKYTNKFGQSPNAFAAMAYESMKVFTSAIQNSLDKELNTGTENFKKDVIDNMKKTKTDGVSGDISFDEHHNPEKQAIIIQIQDGKEQFYKRI